MVGAFISITLPFGWEVVAVRLQVGVGPRESGQIVDLGPQSVGSRPVGKSRERGKGGGRERLACRYAVGEHGALDLLEGSKTRVGEGVRSRPGSMVLRFCAVVPTSATSAPVLVPGPVIREIAGWLLESNQPGFLPLALGGQQAQNSC